MNFFNTSFSFMDRLGFASPSTVHLVEYAFFFDDGFYILDIEVN